MYRCLNQFIWIFHCVCKWAGEKCKKWNLQEHKFIESGEHQKNKKCQQTRRNFVTIHLKNVMTIFKLSLLVCSHLTLHIGKSQMKANYIVVFSQNELQFLTSKKLQKWTNNTDRNVFKSVETPLKNSFYSAILTVTNSMKIYMSICSMFEYGMMFTASFLTCGFPYRFIHFHTV